MDSLDYKYEVEVLKVEKRQKIPDSVKNELRKSGMVDSKGILKIKGVSPKMLKRMKQERVECPVLNKSVHFIQCFVCPNFQSRVMGKVLCKGNLL